MANLVANTRVRAHVLFDAVFFETLPGIAALLTHAALSVRKGIEPAHRTVASVCCLLYVLTRGLL